MRISRRILNSLSIRKSLSFIIQTARQNRNQKWTEFNELLPDVRAADMIRKLKELICQIRIPYLVQAVTLDWESSEGKATSEGTYELAYLWTENRNYTGDFAGSLLEKQCLGRQKN